MRSVTACILAAGQGIRMRSALPKVLHPCMGRTLVEWVVAAAKEAGVGRVVLVVPSESAAIRAVFASDPGVGFAAQVSQRGTGDALLAAREALETAEGEILVLNGDVPGLLPKTLCQMVEHHRERKAGVTMLSARVPDPTGYGRVVRGADGRVEAIVEHKDADDAIRAISEINVGAYVFSRDGLVSDLSGLSPNNRAGELYLTDLVALNLRRGRPVEAVVATSLEEIGGVNDRRQLAAVGEVLRQRILDGHMLAGVTISHPGSTYIEADVEIGADATILPFTVICRGAKIGPRCVVGPFAHIRTGTVLDEAAEIGNFVETKKAHLGPKAKAKHLSYLGDVEVGARANIGAGTITANYDGKRKSETRIGERAFIGSGTVLVAPVSVGDDAVTGAGAVVTRNKHVGDGEVWTGVPARLLKKKGNET